MSRIRHPTCTRPMNLFERHIILFNLLPITNQLKYHYLNAKTIIISLSTYWLLAYLLLMQGLLLVYLLLM